MSNALACARANVFRGVALYASAQLSGCDGGHWPSQHDAGQPESWIPQEAWKFISQF